MSKRILQKYIRSVARVVSWILYEFEGASGNISDYKMLMKESNIIVYCFLDINLDNI